MKHYSGIDYEHFLDDIRDMYPFSLDEAIVVELIANVLDARTSLIDIRIDPVQRTFEMTDNGSGMDVKAFDVYHNFSMSFKKKGEGIGFAGLGAKLALKIADRIITETRLTDGAQTRSKNFWGASEWKFERKRKSAHPVWYDIEDQIMAHHGTRVRIYVKHKSPVLLNAEEVRRVIVKHYLPLLAHGDFYESVKLYGRMTVLVNGEVLSPPQTVPERFKHFILRRGQSRRPFALARFELHSTPLPEEMHGVAISTFGKIITRSYFKQYFKDMDRVTGIIEVPELVECLTTNKCEFRRDGTAGRKYYRFTKIAQQEFRRWLEELQLVERAEQTADKEVQHLQRVVNRIVGEIPDLQQYYGFRTEQPSLARSSDGEFPGAIPEYNPHPEVEREGASEGEELMQKALEEAAREGRTLEEGEGLAAMKRIRSVKFGPSIRYIELPDRSDISWMEGDTVLINRGHATYRKAVEKKVVEYHNLLAVALAMLRDVPTAREKLELLEHFMSGWGKI